MKSYYGATSPVGQLDASTASLPVRVALDNREKIIKIWIMVSANVEVAAAVVTTAAVAAAGMLATIWVLLIVSFPFAGLLQQF